MGLHVFDTLYHPVALERGATLVAPDDDDYRKARRWDHIATAKTWPGEDPALPAARPRLMAGSPGFQPRADGDPRPKLPELRDSAHPRGR